MRSKLKTISCMLAVVLCMAAFSVTAFAAEGDYYASNETGAEVPPDSIDSIVIGTEDVKLPENSGNDACNALTPDGNMSLIDDILQKNPYVSDEGELSEKQFITVQSKNGNYFYLVIDRAGDTENVYFLNLVDEADLLALMEDGETGTETTACSCPDKCVVGSINTSCEICRTNMSECAGKEPVLDTKPEPEPDDGSDQEPENPDKNKKSNTGLLLFVLIAVGGVGGAVYWFKFKNKQPKNKGSSDLDDYNFGQDDEDEEETEIDDADLMAEVEEYNDNDEENNE